MDKPREPGEPFSKRIRRFTARWATRAGLLVLLLTLPFYLLVRTSVWLHDQGVGAGWIPLAGGALLTVLLLLAYGQVAAKRLTGTWGLPPWIRKGLIVLVGAYAVYGVVYLSATNAKSPDVRSSYGAVNPVLRMATATWVLADPGLVVTDASRTLDDYRRMGLPANEGSLHFVQDNGWVHAIDLRTLGRSRWRNGFTALYFWSMGFRTIRHRGTADHLHVSLPT